MQWVALVVGLKSSVLFARQIVDVRNPAIPQGFSGPSMSGLLYKEIFHWRTIGEQRKPSGSEVVEKKTLIQNGQLPLKRTDSRRVSLRSPCIRSFYEVSACLELNLMLRTAFPICVSQFDGGRVFAQLLHLCDINSLIPLLCH